MHRISKTMLKSRDECLKEYRSNYFVDELVRSKKLFKIEKGIYSDNKNVPLLAVLSFKYPNAVITMQTAFYIYGLITVLISVYVLLLYLTLVSLKRSIPQILHNAR